MKIKYWWSDDGVSEICEKTDIVVEHDTICYHCNNIIHAGANAVQLTTHDDVYIIHPHCYNNSTV